MDNSPFLDIIKSLTQSAKTNLQNLNPNNANTAIESTAGIPKDRQTQVSMPQFGNPIEQLKPAASAYIHNPIANAAPQANQDILNGIQAIPQNIQSRINYQRGDQRRQQALDFIHALLSHLVKTGGLTPLINKLQKGKI